MLKPTDKASVRLASKLPGCNVRMLGRLGVTHDIAFTTIFESANILAPEAAKYASSTREAIQESSN